MCPKPLLQAWRPGLPHQGRCSDASLSQRLSFPIPRCRAGARGGRLRALSTGGTQETLLLSLSKPGCTRCCGRTCAAAHASAPQFAVLHSA